MAEPARGHRRCARWRCSPAPSRHAEGRPARQAAAACRRSPTSSKPACPRPSARASREVLLRILNGSLFELLQPERASTPAWRRCSPTTRPQAFMTQAVLSLSDSFFYPAPVLFELSRLQAGAGQRVPGGARARARRSSTSARAADRRRVRDALRPRAPAVGLARARRRQRHAADDRRACPPPATRSTPTPSSSSFEAAAAAKEPA